MYEIKNLPLKLCFIIFHKKSKFIYNIFLFIITVTFIPLVGTIYGQNIKKNSILYPTKDIPLFNTNRNKIGIITPGTPILIINTDGDYLSVKLIGYSIDDASSVIFKKIGTLIILVKLTNNNARPKVLKTQKSEYGTVWNQVEIMGLIKKKYLTNSVSVLWKRVAQLYHRKCTMCHALHKPKEFTANQWPHILKVMARNAGLNPQQKALITKYLQTHARN